MKIRLVICVLLLGLVGSAAEIQAANLRSKQRVKIGVLASLTGSGSSLGKNTVAALEIAADQIETATKGRIRFRLLVRDTQLDPSQALDAIQDLDSRGVNIVFGPQSSSEVAAIKPYADAHNILIISQGSTASSLAIPGDNIFRLCPNDTREAEHSLLYCSTTESARSFRFGEMTRATTACTIRFRYGSRRSEAE